jgi:hypothetical protein
VQPITYIAPPSISEDSIVVYFVAVKNDGGIIISSVTAAPKTLIAKVDSPKGASLNGANIRVASPKGADSLDAVKDSVRTKLIKKGLTLRIANILRAQGTIGGCPLGNVVIVKDSLDHFEVKVEKDTLLHGESSQITVLAKDAENNNIELDGNTKLTLTIDSTHYGSFIGATGDTVVSPLANVLYSDAKAEKIKFTANKTNPIGMEPRRVIIKAVKADDINKSGKDSVYVKRKVVVKIQEHSPWTIWPYLPPQSGGKSRGADRIGYNPKRTFSILIQDGLNNPIKDEPIKISTKYGEGTGGHGHKNGEKTLPQDKQGVFYSDKKKGNPLELITDANGIVKVDSFISSQISGKFLITAQSKTDTTAKDTVNLQVRVPGFIEFGTGDYWSLTGNTSAEGQNHPSNHWCTQTTKDSLVKVLNKFHEWTKTKEGGGKAIIVGINDMCLEWGGVFDIFGDWNLNKKHSFHRVGLSVDIDNKPGDLREKDGTLTEKGKKLKEFMEKCGAIKYEEETIHFGFDNGI